MAGSSCPVGHHRPAPQSWCCPWRSGFAKGENAGKERNEEEKVRNSSVSTDGGGAPGAQARTPPEAFGVTVMEQFKGVERKKWESGAAVD